jgi:hypothetical protein
VKAQRRRPKQELLAHLRAHHATWQLRRKPETYGYGTLLRWHELDHKVGHVYHHHEETP